MQIIMEENLMNSGLTCDDVIGDGPTPRNSEPNTSTTLYHRSGVAASQEKLDSGVCSEHSNRNRYVTKSRNEKPEEMECLFTARGISVFVYEHSTNEKSRIQLLPVVHVSLIQPAFNCSRRADCDTIQISCFDVSFAQCKSHTINIGEFIPGQLAVYNDKTFLIQIGPKKHI